LKAAADKAAKLKVADADFNRAYEAIETIVDEELAVLCRRSSKNPLFKYYNIYITNFPYIY